MAWRPVVVLSLLILATIPFARSIESFVAASRFGRGVFQHAVVALVLLGAAWALHRFARSARRAMGLAAITAAFVALALQLDASPEEAVHLAEYGLLAILLFQALRGSGVVDGTAYLSTFALGAGLGVIDEAIQGLVPGRHWDLRDIGINALAVALATLGVAVVARPELQPITPRSVRWMCRALAVPAVLLALSLTNPRWIEVGHLHRDPAIGAFRSRLTVEALARADAERAADVSAVLDRYAAEASYAEFLRAYPPWDDPFVHEARVHLFRRDRYARLALANGDPAESARQATVASRENLIAERYFGRSVRGSTLAWPEDRARSFAARAAPDDAYQSSVSASLLTSTSRIALVAPLVSLLVALAVVHRRAAQSGSPAVSQGGERPH